jgi:putative ABC transport system ATP-binding protein
MLQTFGLSKQYGLDDAVVDAVRDVSMTVRAGEIVAVTGPSGCGKSTLLHLLAGLDRATSGEIWLAGRRIDQLGERASARMRRRSFGIVFQESHLIEEMSAAENVELPQLMAGRPVREVRRRTAELLDVVQLSGHARRLPATLSGGQRQRVAIARAIANQPPLVLADEPTGNLDSASTAAVLRLFGYLRSLRQTVVVVTHDEQVAAIADRRLAMRDGGLAGPTGPCGQGGMRAG